MRPSQTIPEISPMRDRLLLIAAIAAPLILAFMAVPAEAAENGWLRGSCESGSGIYRWSDGNRYEGGCRNNSF